MRRLDVPAGDDSFNFGPIRSENGPPRRSVAKAGLTLNALRWRKERRHGGGRVRLGEKVHGGSPEIARSAISVIVPILHFGPIRSDKGPKSVDAHPWERQPRRRMWLADESETEQRDSLCRSTAFAAKCMRRACRQTDSRSDCEGMRAAASINRGGWRVGESLPAPAAPPTGPVCSRDAPALCEWRFAAKGNRTINRPRRAGMPSVPGVAPARGWRAWPPL